MSDNVFYSAVERKQDMRSAGLILFGLSFAACVLAAKIDGIWELTITQFGDPEVHRATIETSGAKLTGQYGDIKLEGTVHGDAIQFQARYPDGKPVGDFSAHMIEDVMVGTAKLTGNETAAWTARHAPERPQGAPQSRRFTPRQFRREFSSQFAPVMHLYPGDSVSTSTVDSGGVDANMRRRSAGGNPLTGPFYIEGALPGDTLVVHFNRIRLNRDSAESGDSIVPSLIGPNYYKNAKGQENFDSTWRLDRERGVAMPAHPTERLKNFTVKIEPMLGCVGVAPPGVQALHSGQLGSFGGNMDYNQIREGSTVYLPVFHTGALLFVGDGHAAQGDGELTGDALETSMDVEFTVDVVRDKSSRMPRVENSDFIMALGIAGSAGEALQIATTELARWLEVDYKLNANEVALVLGSSVRYEIAELVDPQVNISAKVAKSVLAQLRQ
jgi:amidase